MINPYVYPSGRSYKIHSNNHSDPITQLVVTTVLALYKEAGATDWDGGAQSRVKLEYKRLSQLLFVKLQLKQGPSAV